jgi:hypothetical protein
MWYSAKAITLNIAGHECWISQSLVPTNGGCGSRFSFLNGDE